MKSGIRVFRLIIMAMVSPVITLTAAPPAPINSFQVLHELNGVTDGGFPVAGLSCLNNQMLGSTYQGGQFYSGTLFSLDTNGNDFNAFHQMTNTPDAGLPTANLLVVGNGFYGVTSAGGTYGNGTIFVGQPDGTGSLLHSFSALDPAAGTNHDGAMPEGSLVLVNGDLIGTAQAGGLYGNGAIFSFATNKSGGSLFHSFTALDPSAGTNADGAAPTCGLIESGGVLYGTTSSGGPGGNGTIFSINTDGSSFKVLHSFSPLIFGAVATTNWDGANPQAGLVFYGGQLFGTASSGGFGAVGTVFSLHTDGTNFNVLHQFTLPDAATGTNADGASPAASLTASNNILYGTAQAGGNSGYGTIFSLSTNSQSFTTLYSFSPEMSDTRTNNDGATPLSNLLLLGNTLYGTALYGGIYGAGTIYSLSLQPTIISGINCQSNASLTLTFVSNTATTRLWAATNLLSPVWVPIYTNQGGGYWQFTDTNTPHVADKYYRTSAP